MLSYRTTPEDQKTASVRHLKMNLNKNLHKSFWKTKKKARTTHYSNLLHKYNRLMQQVTNSGKETLAQVFSCEFCEIFKNTLSCRTPLVAAFESLSHCKLQIFDIMTNKNVLILRTIKKVVQRLYKQTCPNNACFVERVTIKWSEEFIVKSCLWM